MKAVQRNVAFLALLLAAGCAYLGLSSPQTFNQKLAVGYSTVTAIQNTATTLVASGKITPDDAQNVLNQTAVITQSLDVARALYKVDPTTAATKLDSTIVVLQTLQAYLATKGTKI